VLGGGDGKRLEMEGRAEKTRGLEKLMRWE
jgi:hypothetical protein